ncbi:MAG: hypothetical protein FP824_03720 [Euryarchaeota archaeon]|nr:hypothetical protein [Euryarchaeota archaeon]MBU4143309.1 hypothetical protein [Candidatus Thermoplasmatota archaeon]
MKVIELSIEEQGFRVLDPEEFFGQNIDDNKSHDPFFGSFTIIWRFFLHQGRFRACELVWDLALKIAYEWEDKHGKRIHKGTPYYFWGVTCILNGDLEKGFLLMHQALEEDKITYGVDSPTTPAYSFVTLDYEKQDQFFKQKVEEITNFIDGKLNVYRSSREGTLNLSEFKSRFLEFVALREVVFYFAFESFHLKKLLAEIDQRLTKNTLSSLLQANTIFTLCLIIDNVLKHKNPGQWKFSDHLKFLSTQSSLIFNDQKIVELNGAFKTNFSNTVQNLLSSEYRFQDGAALQPIEVDFALVYGFRNFGAHRIEDQPVIYQNFDKISERILNALFFSIEEVYP